MKKKRERVSITREYYDLLCMRSDLIDEIFGGSLAQIREDMFKEVVNMQKRMARVDVVPVEE